MIKIILCFPKSISISQPGSMHAEPACRRGEGNVASPSARRHDRKHFAAMHVVGREFSCCSCLLPWLSIGSCVHTHTVTAWDTQTHPWKSRSISHPPGLPQVTLHFLLARPLAPAPWKHSCPGCTDWVWKYSRNFLNGIVISHHLSQSSVLREFKAGQTNSLASLIPKCRLCKVGKLF